MESNKFFNEADFDITANIESALADISFSAIELPPDLNQSVFDLSKSKDVLDKAVMDNLDLTFTESLQNNQSMRTNGRDSSFNLSKSWRPSKKTSNVSMLHDDLDKEINRALKSIPERLELSMFEKKQQPPPPPTPFAHRPSGILKPSRISKPAPSSNSHLVFDPSALAPLKSRLQKMRQTRSNVAEKSETKKEVVLEDYTHKLRNLIDMIEKEIEHKEKQRQTIISNTEKIKALISRTHNK